MAPFVFHLRSRFRGGSLPVSATNAGATAEPQDVGSVAETGEGLFIGSPFI